MTLAGAAWGGQLPADAGVDLVENGVRVLQVEVLLQVAGGLLAGGAVERHVESDQAGALRAFALGLRGGGGRLWLGFHVWLLGHRLLGGLLDGGLLDRGLLDRGLL